MGQSHTRMKFWTAITLLACVCGDEITPTPITLGYPPARPNNIFQYHIGGLYRAIAKNSIDTAKLETKVTSYKSETTELCKKESAKILELELKLEEQKIFFEDQLKQIK